MVLKRSVRASWAKNQRELNTNTELLDAKNEPKSTEPTEE
jgi:hypothetical protein